MILSYLAGAFKPLHVHIFFQNFERVPNLNPQPSHTCKPLLHPVLVIYQSKTTLLSTLLQQILHISDGRELMNGNQQLNILKINENVEPPIKKSKMHSPEQEEVQVSMMALTGNAGKCMYKIIFKQWYTYTVYCFT